MSITEISVKKPLAVLMGVLLIVGLGVFGYLSLGADLFPSVDTPVITISTKYSGAGTEEIENDVVKPIEDAVSGIAGIDTMKSGSVQGSGYTTIMFKMGTNMNTAFLDVQQALGDISSKIPTDASKPVIKKLDAAAKPIMMLSVSGSVPYSELYDSVDRVKKSMEKISGVGNVTLEGDLVKQLSVNVDKTLSDQYGISINTIMAKLQSENINIPSGQFKQGNSNETIKVLGEFENIEDAKNLLIPMTNGGSIRLADIAAVSLDYPDATQLVRLNGESSIGMFIQKQSDSNVVQTAKAIKEKLDTIKKTLPKGITITIASDTSNYINSSLSEVQKGLLEGIITTIIVMYIFLKNMKSSLIILVAIPTSLVGTFFMMYVFGFTLNMLSLLALSLSIGILVDDSVVVLENIERHLHQGKGLLSAVIEGRKEIAMAAISITLCDMVVFGPIAFMSGMIGQFFRQFGLTVVFAALFSLIVSFTVTPMLASKLLTEKIKMKDNKNKKKGLFEGLINKFNDSYKNFLIFSLDHRWKMVIAVSLLMVFSVALIPMKFISTEFLPKTDQSEFTISMKLTPGSDIKLTDVKVKEVENYLKATQGIKNYFTVIGSDNESSAQITVNLLSKKERKKSQSQIASEMRAWSKQLTGVDLSINEGNGMTAGAASDNSKPIAINIIGPNEEVLKQLSSNLQTSIQAIQGTIDVSNTIQSNSNEIAVKIDKIATAQYGIKPSDISTVLKATSQKGTDGGVFRQNGDEYDVVVKFAKNQIITQKDMSTLKVTNSAGQQFSLDQLAKIYASDSSQQKLRMNRDEMVSIYANVQGRPLGNVNTDIKKLVNELKLPANYEITYGGDQSNMNSAFTSLVQALVLSIILVYMILVVLYDSFLTPFLRMLALPCGLIGSLIILAFTKNTLNIVTMIGLIMLDGLAAKNGTLLIDYTNTLMKNGVPLREALIEAGITRIRPILMTTVTMIVGMLPSALATAEGSEFRQGMAIALIGGMIASTILSPIIIPVVYTLLDDMKIFLSKNKRKSYKHDEGVTV